MKVRQWSRFGGSHRELLAVCSLLSLAACAPTDRVLGDGSAGRDATGGTSAGGSNGGAEALSGSGGSGVSGGTGVAGQVGVAGDSAGGSAGAVAVGGTGGGASCVVNGQIHPSGSVNVPEPLGCNFCNCENGKLIACTTDDCGTQCPVGTQYASRCMECGPADQCLSVEFKCLTTCTAQTDCTDSEYCIDGTCHLTVGVCG